MPRNVQLLLTESVDNLGIVGDVVNVRLGYARNFLLPRSLATKPSEEAIKALAAKRAEAERMLAELRAKRAETAKKLEGMEVALIRSCNDQGILYGAVTQQEIAKALHQKGHEVRPRDVRLPHAIKRVDTYEVHIKFEADLEAVIKLQVVPDRKLELEDQAEEAPAGAAAAAAGAPPEAAGEKKPEGEAGAGEKKSKKSEKSKKE